MVSRVGKGKEVGKGVEEEQCGEANGRVWVSEEEKGGGEEEQEEEAGGVQGQGQSGEAFLTTVCEAACRHGVVCEEGANAVQATHGKCAGTLFYVCEGGSEEGRWSLPPSQVVDISQLLAEAVGMLRVLRPVAAVVPGFVLRGPGIVAEVEVAGIRVVEEDGTVGGVGDEEGGGEENGESGEPSEEVAGGEALVVVAGQCEEEGPEEENEQCGGAEKEQEAEVEAGQDGVLPEGGGAGFLGGVPGEEEKGGSREVAEWFCGVEEKGGVNAE